MKANKVYSGIQSRKVYWCVWVNNKEDPDLAYYISVKNPGDGFNFPLWTHLPYEDVVLICDHIDNYKDKYEN